MDDVDVDDVAAIRTGADLRAAGAVGQAICYAFYAAEAVLVVLAIFGGSRSAGGMLALDITVGVLSVLLLPALDRWLIPTAYVLAVLAALSIAATPVCSLAVLQTARRRKISVAVQVATIALAGHLVRDAWRPVQGLPFEWWAIEAAAVCVALVGWGAYMRSRRLLIGSLRERAQRAETEQARRVAEARTAERGRIAREMHDVLAHRLTLLATYAGALEFRPELSQEKVAEAAGVIRSNVREALVELRHVIYLLRDDDAQTDDGGRGDDGSGSGSEAEGVITLGRPQPGLSDVPELVEQSRNVGAKVHLDMRVADTEQCPQAFGRTAYRVVQEALTNARRHAPGERVLVVIEGRAGHLLTIDVHNALAEQRSESADLGSGTGLIGLAERVRLAGGTVEFGPQEREFRLRVALPWSL